jgi:hypothetical protein
MAGSWDANASFYGVHYFSDPYSCVLDYPAHEPGTETVDMWGVKWVWKEGSPGTHPSANKEDIVIKDIVRWEDSLKVPAIEGEDWTEFTDALSEVDRNQYLVTTAIYPGIFERAGMLLGYENFLVALYDCPDRLNDLLEVICDVKLKIVKDAIKHFKPDMIHSHDDWGTKHSLMMQPGMWRDMIKPHYEKLYGYIKAQGILISHHADCYCESLIEDMVDLGIDIWQGTTPENDIVGIKKQLHGRMTLMGGIAAPVVDTVGATEEDIREEVRRCIREYCPGGYFIPCVTAEVAFTPGVQEIIVDEIKKASISCFD